MYIKISFKPILVGLFLSNIGGGGGFHPPPLVSQEIMFHTFLLAFLSPIHWNRIWVPKTSTRASRRTPWFTFLSFSWSCTNDFKSKFKTLIRNKTKDEIQKLQKLKFCIFYYLLYQYCTAGLHFLYKGGKVSAKYT